MNIVRVFSPATVANVGCGFDTMGFAFRGMGDIIEMYYNDTNDINYIYEGNINLPRNPEKNLMTIALRAIMDASGGRKGVTVRLLQKISPGSGIGSSAASACSAVYAYNLLANLGYSDEELIPFALEGEAMASGAHHADNVAPAMLGGIVLVRENQPLDLIKIKPAMKLFCTIVHPNIEVKTKDSRAVLKPEIPISTAVNQWANLGAFVAALYTGDTALLGRALQDKVAEPYRKQFIPGYDILKNAILEAGAIGTNISGSGPSIFALAETQEIADKIATTMKSHFEKLNIQSNTYASELCLEGTRAINKNQ